MVNDFRVQVAGVLDESELELLLSFPIHDIGFAVGPRVCTPDLPIEEAHRLALKIPSPKTAVAIVYLQTAREIAEYAGKYPGFKKFQLHAEVEKRELELLKQMRPSLFVMQALVVGSRSIDSLENDCRERQSLVDSFILDTYDAKSGARGATGKTHDWQLSRRLIGSTSSPVILAGGLTPQNVSEAIRVARPAGVDVHTGVEDAQGRKDPLRIRQFVDEVSRALASLP